MRNKREDSNMTFIEALERLAKEKGIAKEVIIESLESALTSTYKRAHGESEPNIRIRPDKKTGKLMIFQVCYVVEEVVNDKTEVSLDEAREIDERFEIGDVVEYHLDPMDTDIFSRIATQSTKNVVVNKIKDIERQMIYDKFVDKIGTVVIGQVQRINNSTIFLEIEKAEVFLPQREQVKGERFKVGDYVKVLVLDVKKTTKGPQIYVSRSHPNLVKGLFELEVPEIEEGIVEIRSIAREQGSRSKIAVSTNDSKVDAIGACVGAKGHRVESVTDELFGEKIDVIDWNDDPIELISNVLNPATVEEVIVEEDKVATVVVPDMQLSLAIGKSGQNVRLAAKLCGWKLDIKSRSQYEQGLEETEKEVEIPEEPQVVEEE